MSCSVLTERVDQLIQFMIRQPSLTRSGIFCIRISSGYVVAKGASKGEVVCMTMALSLALSQGIEVHELITYLCR